MKNRSWSFGIMSVFAALILTAYAYRPMFKGMIPFPANFVFDFPPFDPVKPSYPLLPQTNIGDLVTSFYPYRAIASRAVRSGSLPLWNPYMLSGAPFLAMAQSALFYPANFFYYVLPLPVAWSLGFVLLRVLATLFAAMFVRRIGGTPAGAIAAGLMFAFCGFLTGWQGQSMADAAIWLPLICYSVARLHAEPTARSTAIAAFAFSMPVLAGHPETAAHLTATGVALAIFLFIWRPRRAFIGSFAISGLLALAIGAIQILPTLEWLKYVHHSLRDSWPAPPLYSVLGLVSRDIIRAQNTTGLLMPEHAAYLAMMTFIAAPLAFMRTSSRRFAIFFAVTAAVALSAAYAVGPGHWVISQIPFVRALKNARLTLVASFSLTVLAGLGISALEDFASTESNRRRFRAILLAMLGSSIAFILIYVVHLIPAPRVIEFVRVPRFAMLLLLAGGLTIILKATGRASRRAFTVLTLLIIGVDLATVTYGAIPFTMPRDVFPPIPLFERLPKNSEPFRIAQMGYAYGANFEVIYRLSEVGGYEISLERLKTFVSDLALEEPDSVIVTTKAALDGTDRRLDMLNVKYYIVSEWDSRYLDFRKRPERFRFLYSFGNTDVFENLRSFPRAFLVSTSGIEVIRNESKALSRVKDPGFDAEHCVVLPEPAPPGTPAISSISPTATSVTAPKVEWRSMRGNDFELDVSAGEPSVLVISQIDYPGWKAYVDRRAVPLTRANYAFPAIFVPPGTHRVQFSFDPLTFKLGAGFSALATLAVLVMVLGGSNSNHI